MSLNLEEVRRRTLPNGVDINVKYNENSSFMVAKDSGHSNVVDYIRSKGAIVQQLHK